MNKYLCVMCGTTFNKKHETIDHMRLYDTHVVVKKRWRARALDWFLHLPGKRITKFIGCYILYAVTIKHFNIQCSITESVLIGIGLGLAIE